MTEEKPSRYLDRTFTCPVSHAGMTSRTTQNVAPHVASLPSAPKVGVSRGRSPMRGESERSPLSTTPLIKGVGAKQRASDAQQTWQPLICYPVRDVAVTVAFLPDRSLLSTLPKQGLVGGADPCGGSLRGLPSV